MTKAKLVETALTAVAVNPAGAGARPGGFPSGSPDCRGFQRAKCAQVVWVAAALRLKRAQCERERDAYGLCALGAER